MPSNLTGQGRGTAPALAEGRMIKRRIGAGLVLAAALVAAAGQASAQQPVQLPADNTPYGTTAAEFLLFPASARGAALGNGFAALATDVSAVHFNPAGLSLMERAGAQASTMTYVADTRYAWIAAGFPMRGGSAAFGVSITNFGYSDQPVYTVADPENESGEVYSVSQSVLGLTYSQRFSDRFSAGITGKLINDQLGRTSSRAVAIDFGTMFTANISGRAIRAGFTVQNLGTTVTHRGNALDVTVNRDPGDQQDVPQEPVASELRSKGWGLPVTFRVSLAYDAFSSARSRLSVLGEFNQPNNSYPGFNFGGEYSMSLGTSLAAAGRIGYTYAPDNNLDPAGANDPGYAGFESSTSGEGMDGFSAGGGLRWMARSGFSVGFDYAYRHMGLLGGVNMMSIGLSW
jgi:hypothetical protein